jgi:hypothetical protein
MEYRKKKTKTNSDGTTRHVTPAVSPKHSQAYRYCKNIKEPELCALELAEGGYSWVRGCAANFALEKLEFSPAKLRQDLPFYGLSLVFIFL